MWSVFLNEFRQLPRRLGGLKGGLLLAALALLGSLPPFRFGVGFLDPLILLAYTAFAILFASTFSVRTFSEEQGNTGANSDEQWVYGKASAAAAYGFLAFVGILGCALYALNLERAHTVLPPASTLVSLSLLALSLGWLAAAAGGAAALTTQTPASALQMVRLGFFFVLLVLVMGSRFAPLSWREGAASLLHAHVFVRNCLILSAVCLALGWFFARRAIQILKDRRISLSIL